MGVKPRYDGGGSEFGRIHRLLPECRYMFDIDRLWAVLKIKRENEAFVEYQLPTIRFPAFFEVKKNPGVSADNALNPHTANSLARAELCKRIGARQWVVVGRNDGPPWSFYEIDTDTGEAVVEHVLEYDRADIDGTKAAIRKFWIESLGLDI